MKVPPNDSKKGVIESQKPSTSASERARELEQQRREKGAGTTISQVGQDVIDISIGKYLNQELDPAKIAAEREARVAELKELVQAGKYNPDPKEVATKIAESLDDEVSFYRLVNGSDE
jgi:anti-sigma28 factor (negative regulator of flagellin synthesis)